MLLGQAYPSLDEKGRLVLPAQYREKLTSPLYLALGDENQIGVWPREAFDAKVAAKQARQTAGPDGMAEFLLFSSTAAEVRMDAQSRIAIPENLRSLSELGTDRAVTVVGAVDRLEIWNAERFGAFVRREGR